MNDFERVKQAIPDLRPVIEAETGLKWKLHHLEQCPLCGGHNCFSVDKKTPQYFKCFQCDVGGDIVTFMEEYHKIDKAEALRRAADRAGVVLDEKSQSHPKKLPAKDRIFMEAANYYHARMLENGGKDYLIGRRGHKEDVLKSMRVGWTDGNLTKHLIKKDFNGYDIVMSGLGNYTDGGNLIDFFGKGVAIFPHYVGDRVIHFTIKDPEKKLKYQLRAEDRHKAWTFYNQAALKAAEFVIVEGENDLLTVMAAGIRNAAACIGNLADHQIEALKKAAADKTIFLWFDKDDAGRKYIERVCNALRGDKYTVRIVEHPGNDKDPDDYLRGFGGDKRKEARRLLDESVDYLTWRILRIGSIEELDGRLRALKDQGIFRSVAALPEAEKEAFIARLVGLGFSEKAVIEQIEVNQELRQEIGEYFAAAGGSKNADPIRLATIIFKHFQQYGKFFRDPENRVYLLYEHYVYEIGSNRPFNALMKRSCGLLPTKEPGRSLWEALASDAYIHGVIITLASWISTDRATNTIYVNLNSPENRIIRMAADGVKLIENGLNDESVLLRSSKKIMPFSYQPDVRVREGMEALKALVFDNLTCEKEQRYLIMCWLVSAFMLDFSPYSALMKFSGASASGKTTAARLISLLLYGSEHIGDPTGAAAYSVAAQNPLLVIDNLESDDFTKSILKFLLLSASRGGKEKRAGGSDDKTIQETPKALILITAIEPFTKAELINRTFDIDFSHKHKTDDFIEDEVVRELLKKRNLILSALLKFVQSEILPNLAKRRDYIVILKKEHKGHAKNRTDEYLALLMLILEHVVPHMPPYGPDDFQCGLNTDEQAEIRREWINYQNRKAKDTETGSNAILKLFDGLVNEYLMVMREGKLTTQTTVEIDGADQEAKEYTHPVYHLTMAQTLPQVVKDGPEQWSQSWIEFIATSQDIVSALDRLARERGIKNPYTTSSVFGERLKNDKGILKNGAWEIITKPGLEPHYRVIRGQRFYRFRKLLVR